MSGNKNVGLVGDSYVNHFPYHELLKPLGWERLTWAAQGDLKKASEYVKDDCKFVKEILADKGDTRGTAKCSHIVIFLGGGDVSGKNTAKEIAADLLQIAKAFKDGGKVPLICGPNDIKDPAIDAKEYTKKVNIINGILKKEGLQWYVAMPDIKNDTDMADDGCHPSEAGYKKILKAIQDKLNSM